MNHVCREQTYTPQPVTQAMELKVCEACGSLWVRRAGHGTYCRPCAVWLSDFPAPRSLNRGGRPRKRRPDGSLSARRGGSQ